MSSSYDLIVIGAGSGGLAASKRAASYGAKVAIIEANEVGGTCVIRGCVPKKLMVYSSRFAQMFLDAQGYGWKLEPAEFQWSRLRSAVATEVNRLRLLHESFLSKGNVELISGRAHLKSQHEVELLDGRVMKAEKILVAVGGRPFLPPVKGIGSSVVSDQMFLLEQFPKKFAVLGGGYIGLEFASIMRGLGAEVTFLIRRSHILRGFDQELRELLQQALVARGIVVIADQQIKEVQVQGASASIVTDGGIHGEYDQVLAALGRVPNTEDLNLVENGIALDKGRIVVDSEYQSSVANIFAVGDCSSRYALTPVAIAEGRAFADRQFGGKNPTVAYDFIPTAVFTTPELGTVGLTEDAAIKRYGADLVQVFKTSFKPMYESLAGGASRYFMKILVHRESDRVLGVHILGEGAAEMIQCVGVALEAGATKADFDRTMALHPSAAEELVTLYTASN